MPDAYGWVFRQVGTYGRWRPIRLEELPATPLPDERVTMQRFARPDARTGDAHAADLVLDFDAHAPHITLALCRDEALALVAACYDRWRLPASAWQIAFSGNAGFHLTLAASALGDVASPHLTSAYRELARDLRDALGLLTLDAPSARDPAFWQARAASVFETVPPAMRDSDAVAARLRQPGIYTRRRMIRRLGSRHPASGLYKTSLALDDLALDIDAIRQRAARPPPLTPAPDAPLCPALASALESILSALTPHATPARERLPVTPTTLPHDAEAPVCVQRLLAAPPPVGASNQRLLTLAAYWRARGIERDRAIAIAHDWLLSDVRDPALARERAQAATSVVRAAYANGYAFAYPFVAALGVVSPADCATCPLRARCWTSG